MKFSAEVTINAPIDKVFNAFTDVDNKQKYVPDIETVVASGAISSVGSSWTETRSLGGDQASAQYTVTSFNAPNSFEVSNESNGLQSLTSYTFSVGPNGQTTVSAAVKSQGMGLASKLFGSILSSASSLFAQALQKELESYKSAIESNT